MKTAMSEGVLGKVVGELDRHWREGGEFDGEVVGFEFWRRARGMDTSSSSGDPSGQRMDVGNCLPGPNRP